MVSPPQSPHLISMAAGVTHRQRNVFANQLNNCTLYHQLHSIMQEVLLRYRSNRKQTLIVSFNCSSIDRYKYVEGVYPSLLLH